MHAETWPDADTRHGHGHGPEGRQEGRKAGQEGIALVPAIQKHAQVRDMNKDGIVRDHAW
jgi:hypothetical protein